MTVDNTNNTETDGSERTNTCGRCQDEYESYIVLIPDDFSAIVQSQSCEWDNLCKPCRMAVGDYGAYLTESEREELEPKWSVEADNKKQEASTEGEQ